MVVNDDEALDPRALFPDRVDLHEVSEVAPVAREVFARFVADMTESPVRIEIHHIGATALPFGHTKGDVDVNLRVNQSDFSRVVTFLTEHHELAQLHNCTPTWASFSVSGYSLPLGLQVTVIGSPHDFLLGLRDRMRSEPDLLQRYDTCKIAAAPRGREIYLAAKDAFFKELLQQ
jgi:GrpB-like predicted nucleotidyltransferase (UPF0157 family)